MNILITGCNGFIGRNLVIQLKEKFNHTITSINRYNCDLLSSESVKEFFEKENKTYDLVLHTAVEGGRRNKEDSESIVYHNLLMLYNLLANQNYFNNIISFGSGAELDRRYDVNSQAINRYPVDPYGLSKNIIDKLCCAEFKLSNFRIFNCFGMDELPDRMIRCNIQRYWNRQDIVLYENRKMDFFYIDDLATLINFFISSNNIPKTFDCCYTEKYDLYQIAEIINNLDNHKVNIVLSKNTNNINMINTTGKDYIGASNKINIEYIGLHRALKIIYNTYKENKT